MNEGIDHHLIFQQGQETKVHVWNDEFKRGKCVRKDKLQLTAVNLNWPLVAAVWFKLFKCEKLRCKKATVSLSDNSQVA